MCEGTLPGTHAILLPENFKVSWFLNHVFTYPEYGENGEGILHFYCDSLTFFFKGNGLVHLSELASMLNLLPFQ